MSKLGVLGPVALHQARPCFAQVPTTFADAIAKMIVDPVRDQELGVLGPAIAALGQAHFLFAQRLPVGLAGILLVRCAVADMAADDDQRRPVQSLLEPGQGRLERSGVVGVGDMVHCPAVGREPIAHVLAVGEVGRTLDRDVVGIVDPAQIRLSEMARDGSRLARDALHHVAVAAQRVDVVVEQLEAGTVEVLGQPARADRHADAGGGTLAEGPGGGLHARGHPVLGVPGAGAVELPEALDVVERHRGAASAVRLHAGQMQQGIEQHRSVPAGQHEPVAIGPLRIVRVEAEKVLPQRVGDRRQRHRSARMPRVRLLHRVHRQRADRVDAQLVE